MLNSHMLAWRVPHAHFHAIAVHHPGPNRERKPNLGPIYAHGMRKVLNTGQYAEHFKGWKALRPIKVIRADSPGGLSKCGIEGASRCGASVVVI